MVKDSYSNKKNGDYYLLNTFDMPLSSDASSNLLNEEEDSGMDRSEVIASELKSRLDNTYSWWKSLDIRLKVLTAASLFIVLVNVIFFVVNCVWISGSKPRALQDTTEKFAATVTIENYQKFLEPISFLNASFIFNSINSFLKQKDSDVFPVGLSFVPATIAKDTLVYHAGSGVPTTFEWLAMDVEFSLNFGNRGKIVPRGTALVEEQKKTKNRSDDRSNPYGPPEESELYREESPASSKKRDDAVDYCKPLEESDSGSFGSSGGGPFNGKPRTLMTFQLKHKLEKLIYLDGASASKSDFTGEMDTQMILYNQIKKKYPELPETPSESMKERDYADMICKWGEPFGLEGYIRLELGFEVILCDFDKHLTLVSNVSLNSVDTFFALPEPVDISYASGWPINCTDGSLILDDLTLDQRKTLDLEDLRFQQLSSFDSIYSWEQVRVAGYFHDTGDKRIALDYRYLITAINETRLPKDNYDWKVVTDNSDKLEAKLFNKLDTLVHEKENFDAEKSTNWQLKTELIEFKFTPFLKNIQLVLNDSDLTVSEKSLKLTRFSYPIIKRYLNDTLPDRKSPPISEMAVLEYSYPTTSLTTDSDKLIFSSLAKVMEEVMAVISNVYDVALPVANEYLKVGELEKGVYEPQFDELRHKTDALVNNLNWITFGYECSKKCGPNELCFTPSWGPSPVGWVSPKMDSSGRRRPGSDGTLPIGFEADLETGFTRIKNEQECIGLEYFVNRGLNH